MKTHYLKKNAATALVCLGLGMLCWTSSSNGAAQKKEAPGHGGGGDMAQLVLVRTPSVGSGVAATIAIDGKELVNLTQGRSYKGPVAAGKHVISVNPHPNLTGQQPHKTEFTAEKGQTVSFKVGSKSGKVMLEKTS